jgi:hypothetical protein
MLQREAAIRGQHLAKSTRIGEQNVCISLSKQVKEGV